MPRFYHVGAAAAALSCPAKWLDNVLSRHDIPGVLGGCQGVTRRISFEGLLRLAIARAIMAELELPVPRALALAGRILACDRECIGGAECRLCVDVGALRLQLAAGLREAGETAIPARRGRPPLPARVQKGPE